MITRLSRWLPLALILAIPVLPARAQSPSTVLVVANGASPQSVELARYYVAKRHIPASNLLLLKWDADEKGETCDLAFYNKEILAPVMQRIAALKQIDYVVLCRNLPIKIKETNGSVDSALAGHTMQKRPNPYFNGSVPFSAARYGMRLVTRLDGWSWDDARGLVDHSVAAKPTGSFFFDCDPTRDNGGYGWYNQLMRAGHKALAASKRATELEDTIAFAAPDKPLGGYVSWGSNDGHYAPANYLKLKFAPGAIAETAVSTSARFLRFPGQGQSQIAVLIHEGVTGVKGYVSEPYLDAIARPDMLMLRYAAGSNLAEAFYGASAYVGWMDVVLGDPLCAPYSRRKN